MGKGLRFKCKKCKHTYSVHLGIGMSYPSVYEDFTNEIASGKYGEDTKEAFIRTRFAAVNAEETIFICGTCHSWEQRQDPTVYAPNNPEEIAKKHYGDKTVKEWGGLPYAVDSDIEDDFHVLKYYHHRCKKCGGLMLKASSEDIESLPCPKCGEPGEEEGVSIMWD